MGWSQTVPVALNLIDGESTKALRRVAADSFVDVIKDLDERFKSKGQCAFYQAKFHAWRKKHSKSWDEYSEVLNELVDKVFPMLQEETKEQLVLQMYIWQIEHVKVAFGVKYKQQMMLDVAVMVTLEMESYLQSPGIQTSTVAATGQPKKCQQDC